jgi:queuine tRNA-ribosyltransferase
VRLVDQIRSAIEAGQFAEFRTQFLGRYYAARRTA